MERAETTMSLKSCCEIITAVVDDLNVICRLKAKKEPLTT